MKLKLKLPSADTSPTDLLHGEQSAPEPVESPRDRRALAKAEKRSAKTDVDAVGASGDDDESPRERRAKAKAAKKSAVTNVVAGDLEGGSELSPRERRAKAKADQAEAKPSSDGLSPRERRAKSKAEKRGETYKPSMRATARTSGDKSLAGLSEGKKSPLAKSLRSKRPQLRIDRHSSTTAHTCTLYPWGVHSGLGSNGVYLGQDGLGGGNSFCFDAFEAYSSFAEGGTATNTNMMVLGQPGMGKSALIKTLLYRTSAVYGTKRFIAIVDVKGEYAPLAELLNLQVVKLSPGGEVRVNPLEVRGEPELRLNQQSKMMNALLATDLQRGLSPIEETALWHGISAIGKSGDQPTVSDLATVLAAPTSEMAEATRLTQSELVAEMSEIRMSTEKLIDRSLKGMFDGRSTVNIDPLGPGVVIDISAVHDQDDVLPLIMVSATAWLQQILAEHRDRQKLQILDESWRMVAHEGTARYLQSCWKLGRTYGVANCAILHKPSDLGSQSADGSATSKISKGLVADTAVRVSFRQSMDDLRNYGDLLDFNHEEQNAITELRRGQSLWKIGNHAVQLDHLLPKKGPEAWLCNTDQALFVHDDPER